MSRVLHASTRPIPHGRPRVRPVRLDEATEAQRDALQVTPTNTQVSDYVLVLAHDPETLAVLSPLFSATMHDKGGLSRADRELGAIAALIVSRCIHCAAVHAQRDVQLTQTEALTAEIYARGEAAGLPAREQALFDTAVKLSRCPPEVGRVNEALDGERLAIAAAFGLPVRNVRQHFSLSFHVPEGSVHEMNQQMHAQGNGSTGPATFDSRYIFEDVPFGLVPTALLGRIVGRPAVLHEAGIAMFSATAGQDLAAMNDLLPGLGLEETTPEALAALCRQGFTG